MAIDEMRTGERIVDYIEGLRKKGASLDEAIRDAAIEYGKPEEYVREVFEEST